MNTKARMVSVVLVGILVGAIAIKIKQSSTPFSERLVSLDDATRVSALKIYSVKSEEARQKIVDQLIAQDLSPTAPRRLQFALYALRKSGFTSPKVIKPMVDALSSDDAKVREEAMAGLLEMGDAAIPILADALGVWNSGRAQVTTMLSKASPKVVPALIAAVSEPGNMLKNRGAAMVFSQLTQGDTLRAAHAAVPVLTAVMKSTDPILSLNAAFALRVVDPANAAPAAVFLKRVQMADWDNWEVRGWACAEALAGIPAAARQSVPVLSQQMAAAQDGFVGGKRYRRPFLAGMLDKLAPRPSKVSDLAWDLKNRDASIRYRAALKIGTSPKVYASLAGPLVEVLGDKDISVAARAAWALTQIGLPEIKHFGAVAYPKYVALLGRVDEKFVEGFVGMAGPPLGALNEASLPAIVEAVNTGGLRLETADVVLRGSSNVSYLTALMVHNKGSEVRLMSAIALARLAPKTPGLAQELEKGSKRLGKVGDDVRNAQKTVPNSGSKK